jgi:flagellum-specific ATP synthase
MPAEVVGFEEGRVKLMGFTQSTGVRPGAEVVADVPSSFHVGSRMIPVGDGLLGRTIDSLGNPLDGLGPLECCDETPLYAPSFNPMLRAPIREPLDVGVRAVNALLTVGKGQRIGLFAGSGVGKSVLLGMMARYTKAPIVVVGLIGERGREVKEFIEESLGPQGMLKSVVVAAAADTSPLMRLHGAACATAIAEYFRDRGEDVLLIMDSLTRYAMAQREIALALGEPPATKGYPPSVFGRIPALVERAGNGVVGGGSITAFYTVLAEGDDVQDPVADSARAVLDGHIVLSRKIAETGQFPAISVGASISRVMPAIVGERHLGLAYKFKTLSSRYEESKDLINIGAYSRGSDPDIDAAIDRLQPMRQFLKQGMNERAGFDESLTGLSVVLSGVV